MSRSFRRQFAAAALCLLTCTGSAAASPKRERRSWLRSADWKFAGLMLGQFVLANLDVHTSQRCFARFPACHEQNGMFGRHPSPARMYAQMNLYVAGLGAAELYLKDSQRKQKNARFLWLVGPALSLPTNLASSLENIHLYNRFAARCRASGKIVC